MKSSKKPRPDSSAASVRANHRIQADDCESEEPAPPKDPAKVAAAMMLAEGLARSGNSVEMARRPGTIIIIHAEHPDWLSPIASAWEQLMDDTDPSARQGYDEIRLDDWQHQPLVLMPKSGDRLRPTTELGSTVAAALIHGRSIIGISSDPARDLPRRLVDAADMVVTIPPLQPAMLGQILTELTQQDIGTSSITPALAARIVPDDLRMACRLGSSAEAALQRLDLMLGSQSRPPDLTLDGLAGMDEAVAWGLDLARDLDAYRKGAIGWPEVDRGAMLFGPPGVGKTTYARALAGSCGVPLIASSYAQWQAAGHQGDMLKAMRQSFETARQAAPSILFVDELDSFGARTNLAPQHRDYQIQVINAFLECLDGISNREGVVLLGASNHPGRIDEAIVRSGRLERHIAIPLPDQAALERIIRFYLRDDLPKCDLTAASRMALGRSGADIERLVRAARRTARQGKRAMTEDDLMEQLQDVVVEISSTDRRRCAVHEAGHAVVIAVLTPNQLRAVSIRQTASRGGGVLLEPPNAALLTKAEMDVSMVQLLAGRAAEEVLLGEVSSGAGGGEDSDLAKATLLAAASVCAYGLEDNLVWSGMPTPTTVDILLARRPDLAARVNAQLQDAYGRAKELIIGHRSVVDAVVERLLEAETLDGPEIILLSGKNPNQESVGFFPMTGRFSASIH